MKLSIVLTTIFATFATDVPNLCDDVYLDANGSPYVDSLGQMLSRFCRWTGPDAPVWDAHACCSIAGDTARCNVPDKKGRCASGTKVYCEYGAVDRAGAVTCYQPFPDACQMGFCVQSPEVPPPSQAGLACCSAGGVCQMATPEDHEHCDAIGGLWIFCYNGTENTDGTLDCYDYHS